MARVRNACNSGHRCATTPLQTASTGTEDVSFSNFRYSIAIQICKLTGFVVAEYCTLLAKAAVHVPGDVDPVKTAPLLCAGSTVFTALRGSNLKPGDTVAIQGLGGLGHLALQYANRMGYRVIAVSRGADKEKAARAFGAHEYIDSSKGDAGTALKALGGAEVAFTTASSVETFTPLIRGLKILGKLVVISLPGQMTVSHDDMVQRGITVQAWPVGNSQDSERALEFAQRHGVECAVETFPFENVQKAYGMYPSSP